MYGAAGEEVGKMQHLDAEIFSQGLRGSEAS